MTPFSPLVVLVLTLIYTLYTVQVPLVNARPKAIEIHERAGCLDTPSSIATSTCPQSSVVRRSKPERPVEAEQYVEGGESNLIALLVAWISLAAILLGYVVALVLKFDIIELSQLWAQFAGVLCGRGIPP